MSKVYGSFGGSTHWLGIPMRWTALHMARAAYSLCGISGPESQIAKATLADIQQRISLDETVYLAGISVPSHDTGIALVEVSREKGIRLISNDQEERFSRRKHDDRFPEHAIGVFQTRLADCGLTVNDIAAFLFTWDTANSVASGVGMMFDHFPFSLPMGFPKSTPKSNLFHTVKAAQVPGMLGEALKETDPFCYTLLKAMGQHLGAEVLVNTSLNVGAPIAQLPQDALATMKRAAALTALLMIGESGESFLVWHTHETPPPKDGGKQLFEWFGNWQEQVKVN